MSDSSKWDNVKQQNEEIRLLVDVLEVFGDAITGINGKPLSSMVRKIKLKKLKAISLSLGNKHDDTSTASAGADHSSSGQSPAAARRDPVSTSSKFGKTAPLSSSSLLAKAFAKKAAVLSRSIPDKNIYGNQHNTSDIQIEDLPS